MKGVTLAVLGSSRSSKLGVETAVDELRWLPRAGRSVALSPSERSWEVWVDVL